MSRRSTVELGTNASASTVDVVGELAEMERISDVEHVGEGGADRLSVRASQKADRTRDLLADVAAVCYQIDPERPLATLTERTMIRLELGIPASRIDLATALDAASPSTKACRTRTTGRPAARACEASVRGRLASGATRPASAPTVAPLGGFRRGDSPPPPSAGETR